MIHYFLGRDLADRLDIPLARWKRWAREFLPPDPLGGLQSGYARHYSIDEAFTVYLAGNLVSGSRFSIPEVRAILADLHHWLAGQGYRTGAAAEKMLENRDGLPVLEHLILVDRQPVASDLPSGFAYTIRAVIERRQLTGHRRPIHQERYRITRLGGGQDRESHRRSMEQRWIWITRILRRFAEQMEIHPLLFAVLGPDIEMP